MNRIVLAALGLAALSSLPAANVYVSPAGRDADSGARARPFRTIRRALAAMQKNGPGTIWLAPGEYYVGDGLALDKSAGGAPGAPLVIRSEVPGQARITGARPVSGFRPITPEEAKTLISEEARRRVLVADLKAYGFPPLSKLPDKFRAPAREELLFGGVPMQPARWPNAGFTAFTEVVDSGASAPYHWVSRHVYRPGSFRFPGDRPRRWDFSRGVYLHGFWCYDWADETLRAASFNPVTRVLRLAAKHAYGIGNPWRKKSKRRFFAVHVFEELDRPGEYYLDRHAGKLYFWPPGDVTKLPARLSLCRKPLLAAAGVANLELRDLVFENGCGWGIQLTNCTGCRIENCRIRNLGLGGVGIFGGADNHVLRCEVTQTGSMAISIYAGDRKTLTPGKCSVEGCRLHHLGRWDWGRGRGVILGGCGNRVAQNLIHHCSSGAVAYSGNEQTLELNEIHHVCRLYSDVGVFYTGRDWASRGNIVRWNYIHDNTDNPGSGSQAIYLDDCDSGDTVVGNIVCPGVRRGVELGGGRDNTIAGNIFIGLPKGIHVDARGPRAITLDKPGSWNLKAKCEKVGYLSPLWKKRYPRLARILGDHPLLPLGNVMRNNIFIGCKQPFYLAPGVKPEWLRREDNYVWKTSDFPFLPAPGSGAPLDLKLLPRVWKKVPGFAPIPIDKIGPQGRMGPARDGG